MIEPSLTVGLMPRSRPEWYPTGNCSNTLIGKPVAAVSKPRYNAHLHEPFAGESPATTLPLACALLGVLGAIIGSFLNVVIHRVPREQSIVFPNSSCPTCHAKIKAYDNIPILSFLILRGQCRACGAPISPDIRRSKP